MDARSCALLAAITASLALIPASLISFAHCGISALMTAENSEGELPITSEPSSAKRLRTSGSARIRTVSR